MFRHLNLNLAIIIWKFYFFWTDKQCGTISKFASNISSGSAYWHRELAAEEGCLGVTLLLPKFNSMNVTFKYSGILSVTLQNLSTGCCRGVTGNSVKTLSQIIKAHNRFHFTVAEDFHMVSWQYILGLQMQCFRSMKTGKHLLKIGPKLHRGNAEQMLNLSQMYTSGVCFLTRSVMPLQH